MYQRVRRGRRGFADETARLEFQKRRWCKKATKRGETTGKGRTSESGRDNRRINTPCGEIHHTEMQMWRNTLHLCATKAVILQRKTKL